MARAYKNKSIVSGLSVQDILNMDYEKYIKLSTSDLRKVVGRLVSSGNKRLRSFEEHGDISPAYTKVMKSGGYFSTKGKDLNKLRAEFARAREFFASPISTSRDWSKMKKSTVKELKKQGVDVSTEQLNELWGAYEELKKLSPEVANRALKYSTLSEIANRVQDGKFSSEEIAQKVNEQLSKIYEERAALENEVDGVSGFFEL